jgi:PEP-CTERM motif
VKRRRYGNVFERTICCSLCKKVRSMTNAFMAAGLLLLINWGIAQAGTIPINFKVTGGVTTNAQPSPANPIVMDTFTGSGTFAPFGGGAYSDVGTITFGVFPSGFGVMSITSNFVVSLNGGVDTFFGTSVDTFTAPDAMGDQANTGALTILGGTGIFKGATGFASAAGLTLPPPAPISFTGSGQITAPGLTAAPEPGTLAFLGLGMTGLAGAAALRKRRRTS